MAKDRLKFSEKSTAQNNRMPKRKNNTTLMDVAYFGTSL